MNLPLLTPLASTVVLSVCFTYVWWLHRERYLLIWAMAGAIWAARYAWGVVDPILPSHVAWVTPVLALARGTLFVWGGVDMARRRFPAAWWPLAAGALAWMWTAPDELGEIPALFPVYALYGSSMLFVAALVLRAPAFPALERTLAAIPMAAYGLLQFTFPMSGSSLAWFVPWAYLISSVSQLAFAMGILMVYFRTAEAELERRHRSLAEVLNRALAGHLDLCRQCHAVKTEQGAWVTIDRYARLRTGAAFSHGICPTCFERHYGDL